SISMTMRERHLRPLPHPDLDALVERGGLFLQIATDGRGAPNPGGGHMFDPFQQQDIADRVGSSARKQPGVRSIGAGAAEANKRQFRAAKGWLAHQVNEARDVWVGGLPRVATARCKAKRDR